MLYDHLNTFIFKSALPQLRNMYPDSLDFGAGYVHFLLRKVHSEGVEPRIAVSFSMIDKSISAENYESAIKKRNWQDPSAEILGYANTILLLVGFFFVVDQVLPRLREVSEEGIREGLSYVLPHVEGFNSLPRDVQTKSMTFVTRNVSSVLNEVAGNADVDIRDLMNKIVVRVERDNSNQFYRRGARAARDTFLLYWELISRIPSHWYR